jgi:hypothetical protein
MLLQGQVGQQQLGDGSLGSARLGRNGELIKSDLHGRFYEQAVRGNLFSFGSSDTALAAVHAIATTGATAKPVVGLWNPPNSGKNLVVLQANVVMSTVGATGVNPAGLHWVYSTGNLVVTTGSTPVNLGSLYAAGSVAKAFAMATALTGLTNALKYLRASAMCPGLNAAGPATAITQPQNCTIENLDGQFIVPPGGVIALQVGADVSANASNLSSGITWEEVAV